MNKNWLDTYEQIDSRGLVFAAPWGARLWVSGADAKGFLQNFCTNDLLQTPPRSVIEAFFLTTKGHILHHGVLALGEQHVVIYPLGSNASELMQHLARYVIREKVEMKVLDTPWWMVVGDPSGQSAAGTHAPAPGVDAESHAHELSLFNRLTWIIESDSSREEVESAYAEAGYLLLDRTDEGAQVFEALRVESGLPLPHVDYPSGTLPQELDRNRQAIHFEKGCYLGQETVARLDALGHVNKLLRGIRFASDSAPSPGTTLSQGPKQVGQVNSLTYSPRLQAPLGLAIVRREVAQTGTELTWDGGAATVVELPQ